MHYEREDGAVGFDLPDRITVRQQLAFRSKLNMRDDGGVYGRYWNAAPLLVTEWQCELIPDMAGADLDTAVDPRVTEIIIWTADTIANHIAGMETPPKNS